MRIAAILLLWVASASAEPHPAPSHFWASVDDLAKPSTIDVDAEFLKSVSGKFKSPDILCITSPDGMYHRGEGFDGLSCREWYEKLRQEVAKSKDDHRYNIWACWALDPCGKPKR